MSSQRERRPQARLTSASLEDGTCATMREGVRAALAHGDQLVAAHLDDLRASASLACVSGCHHCCSLDVAATFPELAHLAAEIEATFAEPALAALRDRLAARVAEDAAQASGDRPLTGRPCPLLVDSLCSAYDARPLACRGWNSADVSPCIDAAATPAAVHFIPVHRVVRDTAHAISQGIQDGSREVGLDGGALDLPRALHALLEDRHGLTRAWLDGGQLPPSLRSRASGSRPFPA